MKNLLEMIHQENKLKQSKAIAEKSTTISKTNQLIDDVNRYQQSIKQETLQVDPRSRLNRRKTPTRQSHHRSVSPVEILNQQHNTSYISRRSNNSRSISANARSISANARSTASQGSIKNQHSRSHDSLHVQYQKVTNVVVQKAEKSQWKAAERLPAEQKLLQWRLPDIKNVLASSPGKSKVAIREKKRSIDADKTSQDE